MSDGTELDFLRLWNEGEFDKCRKEWPEAPEAVYIGADPLHPLTVIEPDDATTLRAMLTHCAEAKISFTRNNKARQIKLLIKASTMASVGYQNEVRKAIVELVDTGKNWPEVPT